MPTLPIIFFLILIIYRHGRITPNYNNNVITATENTEEQTNQKQESDPNPNEQQHLRYSDVERTDGIRSAEADLDDPNDCSEDPDTDIKPWRGMLRKTDSKININE